MSDITAIILTYNEEKNISDCINSLLPLTKRVIVVDSFSTDNTVKIAESLGAEVFFHEFENQARQFIWAMENIEISTKWIIRFDADERMTSDGVKELAELLIVNANTDVNGIVLRYEVEFLGKKLRHGGMYPSRKMFVFKKGTAHMEDRPIDEHIVLDEGKSIKMKHDCLHHDFKGLTAWIDKHNKYSSKEVESYLANDNKDYQKLNKTAKFKRFLKTKIYYKLPLGIRARLYYWYRYYCKLGFLDGREGKIYAFMQAYWYRYLVDAKIFENKIKNKK